ncbi:hypothetical protein, partial [Vibrio azureus]
LYHRSQYFEWSHLGQSDWLGTVGAKIMSYYQALIAHQPKCYYLPSHKAFANVTETPEHLPSDAVLITIEQAIALSEEWRQEASE